MERGELPHNESHGFRPAAHTCSVCGIKVDLNDDDHHVCGLDKTGKVRPMKASEAHQFRLERDNAHRP